VALLLGALILGFIAARWRLLPGSLRPRVPALGSAALFLLLFALGLSLGSNQELISALPVLGLRAVLLSVGTLGGSVLLVWLVAELGGKGR
jgi:hypothetical protein